MKVKTGVAADIPALVKAMEVIHQESIFRDIPINHDKLVGFLRFCISSPRHVCLVRHDENMNIDGAVIGYVQEYFFSDDLGAWDILFFVSPARRGSILAFQLWKSFRMWAHGVGAKILWLGQSTGIAPDRTRRFYAGLGMAEVGSLFRTPLNLKTEDVATAVKFKDLVASRPAPRRSA